MNNKLFLLTIFIFLVSVLSAESKKSPHGNELKINCTTCHQTNNWNQIKENGFNHNKTHFPLTGQHKNISCRKCHTTLKFNEADNECSSCHTDVHEGTVGLDCSKCHNTNSWIVNNVKQIHRQQGFPLMGAHAVVDCNKCHTSASLLRFDNIRSDCYSCHQNKYESSTAPNHKAAGFSTDCAKCHNMAGRDWTALGNGYDHGFFPLKGGHNLECTVCHYDNFQEKLSPQCSTCHGVKNSNSVPAHKTKFTNYDCNDCHNIMSWTDGVKFPKHESLGRIYSGVHKGKWSSCTDCHINDANYQATCNKCHRFNSGNLP